MPSSPAATSSARKKTTPRKRSRSRRRTKGGGEDDDYMEYDDHDYSEDDEVEEVEETAPTTSMSPNRGRKSAATTKSKLKTEVHDLDTRFGAEEILVVYLGGEEEDEEPQGKTKKKKEKKSNNSKNKKSPNPKKQQKTTRGQKQQGSGRRRGNDKEEEEDDLEERLDQFLVKFGFVRLYHDVLKNESEDDDLNVAWFEAKKHLPKKTSKSKSKANVTNANTVIVLTPEKGHDDDVIPLGSVVCSLTGRVLEHADGKVEIPRSVLQSVENALQRQLREDYNFAEVATEEAQLYPQRMHLRQHMSNNNSNNNRNSNKRRGRGRSSGGRGRPSGGYDDDDDDDDDDDWDDGDNLQSPSRKKRKQDPSSSKSPSATPKSNNKSPPRSASKGQGLLSPSSLKKGETLITKKPVIRLTARPKITVPQDFWKSSPLVPQSASATNAAAVKKGRQSSNSRRATTEEDDAAAVAAATRALADLWPQFCGDTVRASKEVLRAVASGASPSVLKALVNDTAHVADVLVQQSVHVPLTAVDHAILQQDASALEILATAAMEDAKNNNNKTRRVAFPPNTLLERGSGQHRSRFADYNRYQVAASRGGKEGNNAFLKGQLIPRRSGNEGQSILPLTAASLVSLLENHNTVSVDFFKHLVMHPHSWSNNNAVLLDYSFPLHQLLITGHFRLIQAVMPIMLKKGVGLNTLHVDVLGPYSGGGVEKTKSASASDAPSTPTPLQTTTTLEKFKGVSVTKKSDANVSGAARFCPIHCAATNPNPTFLQQLLQVAPEAVTCLDSNEATVLHYAAVSPEPKALQWLLQNYPSLSRDAKTRNGLHAKEIPLFWAARTSRAKNVKLLCSSSSGGGSNARQTVLHVAALSRRSGRLDTVRALVEAGAYVDVFADARLQNKITPSAIAAMQGDLPLLALLVELGADLTVTDKLGRTLAMWAAMNGHVHVLAYLLRAGVYVNAQDSSDNTAVHYAAAYGWVECLKLLVLSEEHGVLAHPDVRNCWSSTPLAVALKKGAYACAAVLLKLGDKVNVNVCDKTGRSLFSSLVGSFLSSIGPSKEDRGDDDKNATTPTLPWAIQQMLDRKDLDVSLTDCENRTVLHYIATSTSASLPVVEHLVQDLLHRGLDPGAVDKHGDDVARLVLKTGALSLAERLLGAMTSIEQSPVVNGSTLLHLLMARLGKNEKPEEFQEVYKRVHCSNWESALDDFGRTPLILAAQNMRNAQKATHWAQSKTIFEFVIESMPNQIYDTLGRKKQYREWESVKKCIDDAKGQVTWTPEMEYERTCFVCTTVFHILTTLDDTVWATKIIEHIANKVINDKSRVKDLINRKSPAGKTPVWHALKKFHEEATPASQQETLVLLKLLYDLGADMNGITHLLFDTVESAIGSGGDVTMVDVLDLNDGSEEEKLAGVHDHVRQKLRAKVQSTLQSKKRARQRAALKERILPYSHVLVDVKPPIDLVDELLRYCCIKVDSTDINGDTALHRAIMLDREKLTIALLPFGDVNACNDKGYCPLALAAEKGFLNLVKELLAKKANVNTADTTGETPLTIAVEKGHTKVVEELLAGGAEVDYIRPRLGSALHGAVCQGRSGVVRTLLRAGCNVDALDAENRTPLHHAIAAAASSSKQELDPIEKQLLAAGANVNALDKYGRSPLAYAFITMETDMDCEYPSKLREHDPIDTFSVLTRVEERNVSKDFADCDKRTVLHLAAAVGASISVLAITETNPELMDKIDADGNTPLAVSLVAGHWDTALLLISKGSNLDVQVTHVDRQRDKNKNVVERSRKVASTMSYALKSKGALSTYMLSASRLPMETILSALLEAGNFQKALQQIQDCHDKKLLRFHGEKSGMTALHYLASVSSFKDAPEFAKALTDVVVEAGVDINATTKSGSTAIHLAALNGHSEIIKILHSHGATVDTKDNDGATPLASFVKGGFLEEEVLRVLLDASKDPAAMANSAVEGSRSSREEREIDSLLDPCSWLLDTDPSRRRAKEAYVERLRKEKDKEKQSSSEDQPGQSTEQPHNMKPFRLGENKDKTDGPDDFMEVDTGNCIEDGPNNPDHTFEANQGESKVIDDERAITVMSTPLIEAVRGKRRRVVNALLFYGADPDGRDSDGRTALHHAVNGLEIDILCLLLQWSPAGLNTKDKHELTPLSYAMLHVLRKRSFAASNFEMILDFSAGVDLESTIDLGIKHNQLTYVEKMLRRSKQSISLSNSNDNPGYKNGDVVWARFSDRGSWQIATVVGVDSPFLSVIPGRVVVPNHSENIFLAIGRLHFSMACPVDESLDAPAAAKGVLMQRFKDTSKSTSERAEFLERYRGTERALIDQLDGDHPSVQCLLSQLPVGAVVGRFVAKNLLLELGRVIAAHANGLYDVELLNGTLHSQMSRTELRTVRPSLQVEIEFNRKISTLHPTLVHSCVRPFLFGSYENMKMLALLEEAGVPLDGTNDEGETPLELARPGSLMQTKLRSAAKTTTEERTVGPVPQPPPPLEGISLVEDSDAALRALHDQGADASERVIPTVNHRCQLDSEGTYVLQDVDKDYFDVLLSKVDVEQGRYGKFVFYKIQVIVDPVQKLFILFTNWGRIGEDGKFQQTPFSSRESAVKEFEKVFKSKTGNSWSDRHMAQEKPRKYKLVRTMKTRVKEPQKLLSSVVENASKPCTLDPSLAETIRFLLNPDKLMSALSELGLNQTQAPFGQISLDTLDQAEAKLKEIKSKLDEPEKENLNDLHDHFESIAKLTSDFYSLLPIDDQIVRPFGRNDHMFRDAVELVRVLRDVTVTKQLLLGAMHRREEHNPIDYAYKALQVRMEPLALDSKERECVQRYIDNTCRDSSVIVNQIFSLVTGSETREDIGNKRLLYHGSKNCNVLGILKQGLRIAPPEAPVTGYAYGKGVYFADQFSKSYGYSSNLHHDSDEQPRAFMFLAEVSLGSQHVALTAEYMESPREGTHSTFAPGQEEPDPTFDVVLDSTGSVVPLGPLHKRRLPQTEVHRWTCSSNGVIINAEQSSKLERVCSDPATTFPATVRIEIAGGQYDVVVQYGPFSHEATASLVGNQDEPPEKDHDPNNSDGSKDPTAGEYQDMTAFNALNSKPATLQLKREKNERHRAFGCSEFIVYDTKQIRLKYLVELTSKEYLEKEFRKERSSASGKNDDDDHDDDDDAMFKGDDDDDAIGAEQAFDETRSSPKNNADLFSESDEEED
ncbi:hypothetical protein ACA910_018384 [Epithemia clementina (nom. ined.)]